MFVAVFWAELWQLGSRSLGKGNTGYVKQSTSRLGAKDAVKLNTAEPSKEQTTELWKGCTDVHRENQPLPDTPHAHRALVCSALHSASECLLLKCGRRLVTA